MQVQVHTDNHVHGSAGLTAHVESVVTVRWNDSAIG